MPCPHNEITIVQRSQRQSAVAAAAYQSGEKLFCEYDQQVKHYPEKRGIVHNEILLPANAPQEYADRNTLWNAAEAVEKQWNSQLARRWVLTIPREIPPDQYAVLVREFCEQQFVSKGMIVDFAIHDPHPPGHNPHAHVLLTMRAMDEHGKWLPKSRKVYDLDENGERIKLPSGRWKSHKEDTVDWNDQKYCEIWRHEWEVIQNRYLEANDRPERVDLRSYARQGLDIVPTVHEGAAVRQMEKRGIQTNIGNLNREIRAANSLMQSIRQLIQNLKGWITELGEKRKELLAQKAAEEATLLPNLLMKYMEIRKEERKDWTRAGQNRGTSQDLKAVSEALSYLRQKGLSTVEDLEAFLESSGKSAADYRNQMKPKEARSKVIDGIEEIKSFLSRQKEVYKIPYETHPADRPRQCVFGGTSNALDFLPLDRSGNRRFIPVMVYPEQAEVHILEDEAASRAYIGQMWAEAMEIYRSGRFKLAFSPAMQRYLKEHQRDFMPEDTKAGMIQAYLDKYTGSMVCSKQLYKEALNHAFDEPKQWEIREINEIMNQCITGWRYFPNPRMFSEYGRQKGWERENPATDSGNPSEKTMDGFVEVAEQMELPF